MNIARWRAAVLAAGLITLAAASTPPAAAEQPEKKTAKPKPAAQEQDSRSAEQLERVLSWLPLETETLAVLRDVPGLKIPVPAEHVKINDNAAPPRDPAEELLGILYGIPAMPLFDLKQGKYTRPLAGKKLRFVVEASCQFRMVPKGPCGISVYKGCHLFVFDEELGAAADALNESLAEDAPATETLVGHKLARFEEPINNNDKWTYFVVVPRPNVLLIATDREYLRELLERMKRPPQKVAFPAESAARKQVEPGACFFAIRRSVSKQQHDLEAMPELVCSYIPNKDAEIKFRYFTEWAAVPDNFRNWRIGESFGIEPTIEPSVRRVSPGVVEVSLRLNRPGAAKAFWLLLFVALGHEVAI